MTKRTKTNKTTNKHLNTNELTKIKGGGFASSVGYMPLPADDDDYGMRTQ